MNEEIKPILHNSSFSYKNIHYDVEFYEIKNGNIPNLNWH